MATIIRSALRSQAAWDAMAPGDQARFDYHFDLMSSWASAIPADLVALDQQWIVEGFNDWPEGLNDALTIAGNITDATRNIIITSAEGHRHKGIPGTGFYISLQRVNTNLLTITTPFVKVIGVEIRQHFDSNWIAIRCNEFSNVFIDKCIVVGTSRSAGAVQTQASNPDFELRRSLIIKRDNAGGNLLQVNSVGTTISSNVFIGAANVISSTSAAPLMRNNVAFDQSVGSYRTASNPESSNNAAWNGTTAPFPDRSGVITTFDVVAGDFLDEPGDDFRIHLGSQLFGEGIDLSADFTTDIEGTTIVPPWPCGFHYPDDGEPPEPGGDKLLIGVSPADAIQVGDVPVDRVMVGSTLVWPEP